MTKYEEMKKSAVNDLLNCFVRGKRTQYLVLAAKATWSENAVDAEKELELYGGIKEAIRTITAYEEAKFGGVITTDFKDSQKTVNRLYRIAIGEVIGEISTIPLVNEHFFDRDVRLDKEMIEQIKKNLKF